MQELDAKQIISKVELYGFVYIKTSNLKFQMKNRKKYDSLVVIFIMNESAKREADNNRVNKSVVVSRKTVVKTTTTTTKDV